MMQLSTLIQELPPDRLMRLQTLMHNMMAGHDVKNELTEFEQTLPAGFRQKMMALVMGAGPDLSGGNFSGFSHSSAATFQSSQAAQASLANPEPEGEPTTMRDARLMILGAISRGELGIIEGYDALFGQE